MEKDYPYVTVKEMENNEQILFELLTGKVDLAFVMIPNFMLLARQIGVQEKLKELKPPVYIAHRGMAVKKGNTELLDFLNLAIRSYHGTPEYEALYRKWYGGPEPFWTAKKIGCLTGNPCRSPARGVALPAV